MKYIFPFSGSESRRRQDSHHKPSNRSRDRMEEDGIPRVDYGNSKRNVCRSYLTTGTHNTALLTFNHGYYPFEPLNDCKGVLEVAGFVRLLICVLVV